MVQTMLDAVGLRRFSVEEYHRMGEGDVVEVYRKPHQGRYESKQVLKGEESVQTLAWPELEVKAEDLLP